MTDWQKTQMKQYMGIMDDFVSGLEDGIRSSLAKKRGIYFLVSFCLF